MSNSADYGSAKSSSESEAVLCVDVNISEAMSIYWDNEDQVWRAYFEAGWTVPFEMSFPNPYYMKEYFDWSLNGGALTEVHIKTVTVGGSQFTYWVSSPDPGSVELRGRVRLYSGIEPDGEFVCEAYSVWRSFVWGDEEEF